MDTIAVVLSIYKNDKPLYIQKAINSVLFQDDVSLDVYIQVDGPVSDEVKEVLIFFSKEKNVFIYYHTDNLGLATRLNETVDIILLQGKYDFIARMDADDISKPNRFIKQMEFLKKNQEISVVGSDVIEINELDEEFFYKKMDSDHDIIKKNIIKKCPFNHPSVMFRTSVFECGHRYKSELMNTQDYYLWVDLLAAGFKFSNINEPLLLFRVNNTFHSRRGMKKALNDIKSRLYACNKLKMTNISNIIHICKLFFLRLSPEFVKRWAYEKFR